MKWIRNILSRIANYLGLDIRPRKKMVLESINEMHKLARHISFRAVDAQGVDLSEVLIRVPYDSFVELTKGIKIKAISTKDVLTDDKGSLISTDMLKDQTENTAKLICVADKGSKMLPHYHTTDEHIYLIQGSYHDIITGDEFEQRSHRHIPAYSIHSFMANEPCMMIVLLEGTRTEMRYSNGVTTLELKS